MTADKGVFQRQAGNILLAKIPPAEWERARPNLHPVTLEARTVLYERLQSLENVYFLKSGYVSLMIDFVGGFQAETGLIGYEGMVGVPLSHGIRTDIAAAVVQTPSAGLRMPAAVFMRELRNMPVLETFVLRHAESLRVQAMQLAGCNGHHSLEARLARCILSIQDRYRANPLPITHESLATLLCAHRPSISVAAKRLQRAGLIQYTSGHLLISDRAGLEAVTCECYQVIRDHTTAMLGHL